MTAADSTRYRRLPGRSPVYRLVASLSNILWLGDDHLLHVETAFFSETYRSFAYGDIQALLLRETPRGLAVNMILGVLAAGCALIAWNTEGGGLPRNIFVGAGAFWLTLLVVNLLRGKTCRCQLQTAAGPHELPSLNRVRPARRAWRLLMEKVEAAQGALAPEDAARQMAAQPRQPRVNEFDY